MVGRMGLPMCVGCQREFFKVGLGGIELGVTAACEKKSGFGLWR